MATLNKIEADLARLMALVQDSDGELTPEMEAELAQVEADLDGKADAYASVVRRTEAEADYCKVDKDRLGKREQAFRNTARKLRDRFREFMVRQGRSEVRTPLNSWLIRSNGGNPPLLIDPQAELPDEYILVERSPNRGAILADLKAGKEVPGCQLGQRGASLMLK